METEKKRFCSADSEHPVSQIPAKVMQGVTAPVGGTVGDIHKLIQADPRTSRAPRCGTFRRFLLSHAKVLRRDGTGGPFSLVGRAPLELVVDWLDKIIRNTVGRSQPPGAPASLPAGCEDNQLAGKDAGAPSSRRCEPESVEIDGVRFRPGQLKGATLAVAGGAQFGKTVLELNLMAYATAIRFLSVGNYLPDRPKVEEIVGQKFRPNVLDLYPWMAEMIQLGKVQNASGKTIDRKESYTVTDGARKSFGNFCGMHKPPTSITLDIALLDEVDDIDERNVGYVDARMTSSPLRLTCFIGTQRLAGSGQNARLRASSFHVKLTPCPRCGKEWCLEEEFPRCVRVSRMNHHGDTENTENLTGQTSPACPTPDPIITPETGYDRLARYYVACPECGAELDREAGRYLARHPERIAQARLGVRVSQLNIAAIALDEIVGAWYAAFDDPSGSALTAFCCDRLAIPNAGAAQPVTQSVLDECRRLGTAEPDEPAAPYEMAAAWGPAERACLRVAGIDLGPRCWFWCDEVRSPLVSACVWAELISSGNALARVPELVAGLGIQCVYLDAGGEPDLTKRLVLALNGLEDYIPPPLPRQELLRSQFCNVGAGLTWDGERGRWGGLRAAAVLFVSGHARGLEQTIGFTQEGRIYPLIKCDRSESIQTAVNDFLTPAQGVLESVDCMAAGPQTESDVPVSEMPAGVGGGTAPKRLRQCPRARLPRSCAGAGVSQAVLDGHLLNLRKERDPRTGAEDWAQGLENHLGLAKTYARLAQTVMQINQGPLFGALRGIRTGGNRSVPHFRARRLTG